MRKYIYHIDGYTDKEYPLESHSPFRKVHIDFDRYIITYARWQIAPFLRLFYWYLSKRFIIERTLIHHNVFRCEEGIHCSAWEMNWNITTWSWHYKSGRYAKRK